LAGLSSRALEKARSEGLGWGRLRPTTSLPPALAGSLRPRHLLPSPRNRAVDEGVGEGLAAAPAVLALLDVGKLLETPTSARPVRAAVGWLEVPSLLHRCAPPQSSARPTRRKRMLSRRFDERMAAAHVC
jgi:hypothetical protein